jgi:hypothetical protein
MVQLEQGKSQSHFSLRTDRQTGPKVMKMLQIINKNSEIGMGGEKSQTNYFLFAEEFE